MKEHSAQSLYELLIALDSFFLATYTISKYALTFPHTFYYYLIIAAFYLTQIWVFRGMLYAYRKIREKVRSKRNKTVLFEQRPEAQW